MPIETTGRKLEKTYAQSVREWERPEWKWMSEQEAADR